MHLQTVGLLISLAILIIGGQLAIKSLTKISRMLKVSEFAAGFLIMAICTTLPELFVGINSAITGVPGLSLGNALGSNIVNLTFIAGIGIVIARGYKVKTEGLEKNARLMLMLSLLPIIFLWSGKTISRIEGGVLVALFFWYVAHIYYNHRYTKKFEEKCCKNKLMIFAVFLLSIILLVGGSKLAVMFSQHIAEHLGIPTYFIGLIIIAVGTSLPELTFAISAFLNHQGEMSLGNLVGSVIANSTMIIGITAVISPIKDISISSSTIFAGICSIIFTFFLATKKELSFKEGIILLGTYVVFLIVEIFMINV